MARIIQDMGIVTAYGLAVEKGYSGTQDEYAQMLAAMPEKLAEAASNANTAIEAAETATQAIANVQDSVAAAAREADNAAGSAALAEEYVGRAENSAQVAAETVASIADEFNAGDDYEAGDYVFYDAALYKFTADHPAGAWIGTDAELTSIQAVSTLANEKYDEVSSQLNEVTEILDEAVDTISGIQIQFGIYGAKWDRVSNKLTRTRAAAAITTDTSTFGHFGTINENYSNPFDGLYPWSEMKVVNVDMTKYRSGNYSLKQCISATYGDPDFRYYGTYYQFVGRYRPEFWYDSVEYDDGSIEFLVSPIDCPGFKHAPEAIDGISHMVAAGEYATSGSGVPLDMALSSLNTKARTSGFTLQDIYTIDQQMILYLVEYANMNAQEAIGSGCSSCGSTYNFAIYEVESDEVTEFDVYNSTMAPLANLIHVGTCLYFKVAGSSTYSYSATVASFTVSGSVYHIVLDKEIGIDEDMLMNVNGVSSCEFPLIGGSVGNASGYLGTNGKSNAWYRGAVLYGNKYSYVLGIYREQTTGNLWLCPLDLDPADYNLLNPSVHIDTEISLPAATTTGNWRVCGSDMQRIPGLAAFMAVGEETGDSQTPVGDKQNVPWTPSSSSLLTYGGDSMQDWSDGVYCAYWGNFPANHNISTSALPILKATGRSGA